MKKRASKDCLRVFAFLLAGVLLFSGCTLPHELARYLDFKFSDYLKMTDGIFWGIPCAYIRVSSDYGYRFHPITGKWSGHKGIDLSAPMGTPIHASRAGVICFAGEDTEASGGGIYVSIDHQDGFKTQYMHMKEFVVEVGQEVGIGELIGYVGDTGKTTGPHLHFVIRKWNEETETWDWLDPNDYLDFY